MGSEYMSSGCESGWTMYLEDHSMNPSSSSSLRDSPPVVDDEEYNISNNQRCSRRSKHHDDDKEEEEEDLSMLSDASSPNLHHLLQLQGYFTPKTECNSTQPHQNYITTYDSHFLDDTASSHLMDLYPSNGYIPTNNTTPPVDTFSQYPSHGFFQRGFEGSSALQHQLGFAIMPPPSSIIPTNSHSPVVRLEKGYRV